MGLRVGARVVRVGVSVGVVVGSRVGVRVGVIAWSRVGVRVGANYWE